MIVAGKLIEYLDNGKFVCAFVMESQPKRLRLINQNGREVNLPTSRVVHCSNLTHQTCLNREILSRQLLETTEKRCSLMQSINLQEIWELTAEDGSHSFSPAFLTELTFGEVANDDSISAFLRCVFEDKLFFKYKEGLILANHPEKVEQLQIQLTKEAKREQLVNEGATFINRILSSNSPPEKHRSTEEETLKI
ncbi:MAG: ribonuclease R, partial [Proteobacteria bacterium]|nr:ribonuclease R [Pseudomonadota bacterium]